MKSGKQRAKPAVGNLAANFELQDSEGESISLQELVAEEPIILLFYRGDW